MTTAADYYPLCAAIRAEPDDDNVRLVFADWLDERPILLPCPHCDGVGDATAKSGIYAHWRPCSDCKGTGSIRDNTPHALAELVRVQVESAKHPRRVVLDEDGDGRGVLLARRGGPDYYELPWETAYHYGLRVGDRVDVLRRKGEKTGWLYGLRVVQVSGDDQPVESDCILRRDAGSGPDPVPHLRAREAAILAANPTLRPECPACKGVGSNTGECSCCKGTGRIGTYRRGTLTLAVPSLTTLWKHVPVASIRRRQWQLTDYGQMLRDRYPWVTAVEVGDKRPFFYFDSSTYSWSRDRPTYSDDPANALPSFIWDLLPLGNVYDTSDLARASAWWAIALALFAPGKRR